MIDRIVPLAEQIAKKNGHLSHFFDETRQAAEKEVMTAQTITACVVSYNEYGECFSIKGKLQNGAGGLVDNIGAYAWMIENGYFTEGKQLIWGIRKVVVVPTEKLLTKLERYFAAKL